jgi:hypothetical protein
MRDLRGKNTYAARIAEIGEEGIKVLHETGKMQVEGSYANNGELHRVG